MRKGKRFVDLTGKIFGDLKVLSLVGKTEDNKRYIDVINKKDYINVVKTIFITDILYTLVDPRIKLAK